MKNTLGVLKITKDNVSQVIDENGISISGVLLIESLVGIREKARKEKKYDLADWIRDLLASAKIQLVDRPEGTEWSIMDDCPWLEHLRKNRDGSNTTSSS